MMLPRLQDPSNHPVYPMDIDTQILYGLHCACYLENYLIQNVQGNLSLILEVVSQSSSS